MLVDIGCCLLVLDVVGWCLLVFLVSFDHGWRWLVFVGVGVGVGDGLVGTCWRWLVLVGVGDGLVGRGITRALGQKHSQYLL